MSVRGIKTFATACIAIAVVSPAFSQSNPTSNEPAQPQAARTDVRVIGKLGQSTSPTYIYSNMNTSAKRLWNLKEFQYVVINPTKYDKWLAVLLQNGQTGYVLAEKVAQLPYDVEVPRNLKLTSRSSSSGRSTGNPSDKAEMLQYSFKYIGTPYKWGGNDLNNGIDCSAFVQQLFGRIGVNLPRTAAEQAHVGQKIERLEDLQPGDRLYFWDKKRNKIGHTGIFLGFFQDGGAYFIHSSSNNKGVDTDDLRNKKWLDMLVAARR